MLQNFGLKEHEVNQREETFGPNSPPLNHMVLDLNQTKKSLKEAEENYNSTRDILAVELEEKHKLEEQLNMASERI